MHRSVKGVAQKARTARSRQPASTRERRWAKLNLLATLVRRDLESQYKGSILGNLWPLLNQLSQLVIYTYVFSIVLKVKLKLAGFPENSDITFGVWLFAGLPPLECFHQRFDQVGSIRGGAAKFSQKSGIFPSVCCP